MTQQNAIEYYSEIATEFNDKYSNSENFKERFAIWTQFIDKYSNHAYRVLDLGCGSGIFTMYLCKRNGFAIGLDGSVKMLQICNQRKSDTNTNNVDFVNCDICDLRKSVAEKVDMIICSSILEYLDDLDNSLNLVSSCLKQGGLLLFSMPNKQSLYRRIEPATFKVFGWPKYYSFIKQVCTLKEIEKSLGKAGFTLLESAYYGATPFLSRILRPTGLSHYSDNLFIAAAQLSTAGIQVASNVKQVASEVR